MKNSLVLIALICIMASSHAQSKDNATQIREYPSVQVLDWSQRGIVQSGNFFDETYDQIIKQIGKEEFEKVKKYGNVHGWPEKLKTNLFDQTDTASTRFISENFKKLHVYKIATYTHYLEGKDWGRYVILKAPYRENDFLESTGNWDAIYFIMEEKYTKLLSSIR